MRKAFLLSSAAFLAFAAAAADASAAAEPETVVVTATRTPQPLAVTGTAMSVITASDIATRQMSIVADVLAEMPGITTVRNGGVGQNAGILMRGAEAGQTLVLIDGIRINDPSATSGSAALGDVLVNGIDRVEVLRGPQSTLYGSDAIGGVVNIITQRGGDNALRAQAEAGSFDTVHLNLSGNGTAGPLEFGAASNAYFSNSVSAADARDGNGERDGYHHFGAAANLRWHVIDELSLDARLYYTQARDSFDGYPPPAYSFADTHQYGDNSLLAFYGSANLDLMGGRFKNRLSVTRSDSDRKTYDTVEDFSAKGGATRLEYQGVFELDKNNEISLGAESQTTGFDSLSLYDAGPIHGGDRIDGVYGQWQTTLLDSVTLTGGVRFDHDREFGDHTSFKLAGAWQALDGTTLRANLGGGFKAPSLYQLYSAYSNPLENLKPETAGGWEAGIDQQLWNARLSLTYFERRTANQIDYFSCTGVSTPACDLRAVQGGYYYNVDRSLAKGVEAEIAAKLAEGLDLTVAYTNLSDIDRATGLQLARRPYDSGSAYLTWQALPSLSLGAGVDYVGRRFDDAGHTTALDGAAHLKLFAACKLGEHLELFGRVENLGDDLRQPVAGYGAMGRAYYAGIRASL